MSQFFPNITWWDMHIYSMRISQAYFLLKEVQQAHDVQQDDNEMISIQKEAVMGLAMVMSQNLPRSTDPTPPPTPPEREREGERRRRRRS